MTKNLVQQTLINVKRFSKFGQSQVESITWGFDSGYLVMDQGTCCFNKLLHSVWEAQLWVTVFDCWGEIESVFGFTAL